MASHPMRRVSVRNVAAHKLRLVLSVLAVVLGTAFVTGSLVFTGTLRDTFDGLLSEGMKDISAQVEAPDERSPGVPVETVDRARTLPGVARVQAETSGAAVLLDSGGAPYQTGGAPTEGFAWVAADQQITTTDTLVDGREPTAPGEVALPRDAIDKAGLHVGGPARVYTPASGTIDVTVVGAYTAATDAGGYVGVGFAPDQARQLFTDGSHVRSVAVRAVEGTSEQQLRDTLAAAFPDQKVRTGDEVREEASKQLGDMLKFVNYFFVAFGLVALLVGTFIIFNTFSMLVAQRLRELALLRAIGASRRQVTGSVLVEAVLTGVVGAALGVLAGFGLAALIFRVLEAFDLGLPSGGLAVSAQSVIVPFLLGLGVTIVSAWLPARRAGRVAPVSAMRTGVTAGETGGAGRTALGVYLLVAGLAIAVIGTWSDVTKTGAICVGVGALGLVLGAFLVMPALARPVAGGIGRVIGAPFGSVGRLASTNAGRNTRRTAATAFALTLGLALVAAFGTIGASTKASLDSTVGKGVNADVIVQGVRSQGQPMPLPADLPDRVRGVEGVGDVVAYSFGFGEVGGEPSMVGAIDGAVDRVLDTGLVSGSAQPGPGTMVVSQKTARQKGWSLGSSVPVRSVTGESFTLTVGGVYSQDTLVGPFYTGREVYDRLVPEQQRSTAMVMARAADGVDAGRLRESVSGALADLPPAQVQTKKEFVDESAGGIDQMLTIIYALLGLALVVAVLGIVNTLALSVIERRSEVGMLRAVGMQRRQVALTVVLESTQIAVFGALVGAALGVFLGWAFVSVLAAEGLGVMTIPWGVIGVVLLCSAGVGVLASVWPAYSASRTSPLEAITD